MYAGDANESGTLGRGMWIKICGVTNEEDALLAVALGADALGFVFAPGSPRQVNPETVGEILHRLPSGVITVGVFRDETKERVVELVNTLGLGGAQLHGREPRSDVGGSASGCRS
jgi:phosphoribosylanthranilate isomerase